MILWLEVFVCFFYDGASTLPSIWYKRQHPEHLSFLFQIKILDFMIAKMYLKAQGQCLMKSQTRGVSEQRFQYLYPFPTFRGQVATTATVPFLQWPLLLCIVLFQRRLGRHSTWISFRPKIKVLLFAPVFTTTGSYCFCCSFRLTVLSFLFLYILHIKIVSHLGNFVIEDTDFIKQGWANLCSPPDATGLPAPSSHHPSLLFYTGCR